VWWIGADALLGGGPDIDVALCTAERLDEALDITATGAGEVAVLSLDAFGRPAPDLPIGVTDYATAVRVHGDQIVAEQHPGPALAGRSVQQVLGACQKAAASKALTARDRVISTKPWDTPDDVIDGLLSVLAVGGSLVYVANPDPTALSRRIETEKVTRTAD
ncbi:MAG: TIGR03089 family protein, partial [Mycobacterium sp.]|uniref:TIGR03089 family protein n=1 Tax=Mycobacterium sp. TaxID=1785 RepID=UPI003CB8609C